MKGIGIAFVVCACAGGGIVAARRLHNGECLWRAWVILLQRLYNELRYTAMPLSQLFRVVKTDDLAPLAWLAEYRENEEDWAPPKALTSEEREFAEGFFSGLGVTDLDGQLRHIEHYLQRAQEAVQTAREAYEHGAKAYATTGICAGLCLGLLLL